MQGPEGGIPNPLKISDGHNRIHVKADCASTVVDEVDDGETDIFGLQAKMMEALGFVDIRDDELLVGDDENVDSRSEHTAEPARVQHKVQTEAFSQTPVSRVFPNQTFHPSFREPVHATNELARYYPPRSYVHGPWGFGFYPSCFRQALARTSPPCKEVASHDGVRQTRKDVPQKSDTKAVPDARDMRETMGIKAPVESKYAVYQKEWPALPSHYMMNPMAPWNVSFADDGQGTQECLTGIHGKYQPYCNQIITPTLNEAAYTALFELKRLQQMADASLTHEQDGPSKVFVSPKRYYCSLKEVSKVIESCKLIIIAPDVKPSSTAACKPVRLLMSVIEEATKEGTPYIFALSRRGIGSVFGKDKNMSIMAIMSLDGIEKECQIMIEEAKRGRESYVQSRSS